MATQDKLLKTLEQLQSLIHNTTTSDASTKRKEKIHHSHFIVEALTNPTIKVGPKFNTLLSISMETLLLLCDDPESDIRMVADECLNKLIRAMTHNIGKVLIELLKELRKNASAGALRAALSRFSLLVHHIRPLKGKSYVANIVPCLVKTIERNEDAVHETVAQALPKIFSVLGCYTSDNDIKTLLRALFINIVHTSAAIRRTNASGILTVCTSSRKPLMFLTYSLNYFLDSIVPVQEFHATPYILGTLMALKLLLPKYIALDLSPDVDVKTPSRSNQKQPIAKPFDLNRYLQVYELCLHYTSNSDHNVVNAALETFNILLIHCPKDLKEALTSSGGINKSRISAFDLLMRKPRSPSQISIATTMLSEDNLLLDSDLADVTSRSSIEKWIDESKLTVINVNYVEGSNEGSAKPVDIISTAEPSTSSFDMIDNHCSYSNMSMAEISDQFEDITVNDSIHDNLSKLMLSENSSEKSFSQKYDDFSLNTSRKYTALKDVNIGTFLDKNVPLIYCSRLLLKQFLLSGFPSQIISDRDVRVSVKNLTLTCLGQILRMQPDIIHLSLECAKAVASISSQSIEHSISHQNLQWISDLLLYADHGDPQLRGTTRVLIGHYLRAIYTNCEDKSYNKETGRVTVDALMELLLQGLRDESSHCIRQTLHALRTSLNCILESIDSLKCRRIIEELPNLAKNPHWLVKVNLLDLVTRLDYIIIHYVCDSSEFQNKVIYNILFELMKDDDQRVRNASSQAFNKLVLKIDKIIPILYCYKDFHTVQHVINRSISFTSHHFPTCNYEKEIYISKQSLISSMPFPYNYIEKKYAKCDEDSLARLINKLHLRLLDNSSKYSIYGCIETLSSLICAYPSTQYSTVWNCFESYCQIESTFTFQRSISSNGNIESMPNTTIESSCDLISICVNMLTNSTLVYDLKFHMQLLKLTGNVFAGKALQSLQPIAIPNTTLNQTKPEIWQMFSNDKSLSSLSEQLLSHVLKILNVISHVLDEVQPILPQSKPILPNLPSASQALASPIKRRSSKGSDVGGDKKILTPIAKIINIGDWQQDDKQAERKIGVGECVKVEGMGYFANVPHYMKVYEVLRSAYNNYKITLDSNASENFLSFVNIALSSMAQILEIATQVESGRIAEEILTFLRASFTLDPSASVGCVQQLLKSLFGTNLTIESVDVLEKSKSTTDTIKREGGFYTNIVQEPYNDIAKYVTLLHKNGKQEFHSDTNLMGYLHRKDSLKANTKGNDKTLENYIRIFEPMVIMSLKQYTITTDVNLQCHVLSLLSQLIHLRVNYCLLDSEQVFIGFVLKQFEFIERGQIMMSEELVPKIFQFLVHLSYSKQHSKSIIDIPKIMQLCDALLASDVSSRTHCIPALKPIVEDIFLLRNKSNTSDFKELETTREVLLAMLLKLIEYGDIMELLILVLHEAKFSDSNEKWLRWSSLILEVFLGALKQNKIRIEEAECFGIMKRLVLVMNPNASRPIDSVIQALLQEPPDNDDSDLIFIRWFGKVNILSLILLQMKEIHLLKKITELQSDISPQIIFRNVKRMIDPLNVTNTDDLFEDMTPEAIYCYFLFRIIDIISFFCNKTVNTSQSFPAMQQCSQFLLYCSYIFQSGSHCKITNNAIALINDKKYMETFQIDTICKNFLEMRSFYPLLTCQWCHILGLLNHNSSRSFWCSILQLSNFSGDTNINTMKEESDDRNGSINMEIVRVGGLISYADYLSENLANGAEISWLIVNNIKLLIELESELSISELISAIHRHSDASHLFIQTINTKCLSLREPEFKKKLLKSVENVHPSQTGALICLLLPKMLNTRQLPISILVANLSGRKIEYLLTLTTEEVTEQLPKHNLLKIMDDLIELKLAKRYEGLVSLLNKLATKFYDLSPIEFHQLRSINPQYISTLDIDKAWYLAQIRSHFSNAKDARDTSLLLNELEYDDLITIFNHKVVNKSILKYCFQKNSNGNIQRAATDTLLKCVNNIVSTVPKNHQVLKSKLLDFDTRYHGQLRDLLEEIIFWDYFTSLLPAIISFIKNYRQQIEIQENSFMDLFKFTILSLESANILLNSSSKEDPNINLLSTVLLCTEKVLKFIPQNILQQDCCVIRLCIAVNCLYNLVSFLLTTAEPLPSLDFGGFMKSIAASQDESNEAQIALTACKQLSTLLHWLENKQHKEMRIQKSLLKSVSHIVISLSRLSTFNSFMLTPMALWRQNTQLALSGKFKTKAPPIPIEYLQDVDILQEFIFRINYVGWTTRQQFEEAWVCLLSVLSAVPDEDSLPEEVQTITHANSLAVQAITALLLETLYIPQPGNKLTSKLLHVPRYIQLLNESTMSHNIKKLRSLQDIFLKHLNEFAPTCSKQSYIFYTQNLERTDAYSYNFGQLSVQYLIHSSKIVDAPSENANRIRNLYLDRESILQDVGLDITSCLQFLIDLYTQWIRSSATSLKMLHETIKSILTISDLFNERSQFSWMLDLFVDLTKTHPQEDFIIHQYLIVGLCKCAAVLSPDMEIHELIKKNMFKGNLQKKIASIYGLLYLFESFFAGNVVIGGISDEMQLFLPMTTDYIISNITSTNGMILQCQEHTLLLWTVAFYLIENMDGTHLENEFIDVVSYAAIAALSDPNINVVIYNSIIKGLGRLIVLNKLHEKTCENIMKLSLDLLKLSNTVISFPAIRLLFCCMYTAYSDQLDNTRANGTVQANPENLVQIIEKISALFDRIKRGCLMEVEIICAVLPSLLNDFYAPSLLTKVIGEFLSPQQQYPKFLSQVVFQLFQRAIDESQLSLLQDWVVFSLGNFTHSFSVGMATWYLTCFFVSASTNSHLRNVFPYIQSRVGRHEYRDRKMLCIAANDFYNRLSVDLKCTFVGTLRKVEHVEESAFKDILSCLQLKEIEDV